MADDPQITIDDEWGARQRVRMVEEQLRARGISDARVLAAMGAVPRERFVPASTRFQAYDDGALAVGEGQTISQPYIVGYMTAELDVGAEHRVLEVGTGTGYQTAVLARLATRVYTVERLPRLAQAAAETLAALGVANVVTRVGDGSLGWPEEAPFDRIIVTAGAPGVPQTLLNQLTDGGILVAPVGELSSQRLVRVVRRGRTFHERPGIGCRFVKLIGGEGWNENGS
ncbi:MAG: protein-L-isoaspartate(D-aspartate) O-methyltransferase [Phycisphaerales bacterium]|nr:MAG: protein-L-isoaspartate(D-aspartate) O-methyltransferase [Phycisphaerales bacterium]